MSERNLRRLPISEFRLGDNGGQTENFDPSFKGTEEESSEREADGVDGCAPLWRAIRLFRRCISPSCYSTYSLGSLPQGGVKADEIGIRVVGHCNVTVEIRIGVSGAACDEGG